MRHLNTPVGWSYTIDRNGKRSPLRNVIKRTTTPRGIDVIHSEIIYRKI